MTVSKRLTSKSGITIPKQVRAETGFTPGMAVDLEVTAKGVLVTPHCPTCRFCGSIEKVVSIQKIDLCHSCAAALKREVDERGL